MGQTGEDRHLDENSDDETDEEEDEQSEDEDEDVTGSEDEDGEGDEDEDDEDDDDEEVDQDNKNVIGDEANKFATSNIVEDYGVEGVPGDEDLEKGERSRTSEDDSQRSKKKLGLLCCCLLILAIIGIVLGVTLGKEDDESTTTKAATTRPPVPAPITPAPIPVTLPPTTAAPTATSLQYTIPASADSYIFLSGGEEGPFGQEESLLIQRMDSGESLALLNFDIPLLPPREVLGFSPKAFLVLTLVEENGRALQEGNATMEDTTFMEGNATMEDTTFMEGNTTMDDTTFMEGNTTMEDTATVEGNATIEDTATMEGNTTMEDTATMEGNGTSSMPLLTLKTALISGYSGDIEDITANSSSLLEQLNRTKGPAFQILQGKREISVDISSLLASSMDAESPDTGIVLRRLQMPGSSKILLELTADDADGNSGSVRFYSSQSSSPPRIEIDLADTTSACPICGEGNNVTNPDMELDLPQIGNVTCEELEFITSTGGVSEENCALLQPYIYSFCCENADSAKIFVCDLCLDGGNITNPTTILSITGQTNRTCGEYQGIAMQGLIPTELCAPLQLLSDEVCCGIAI